jgi:Tfp pilus assembly protein PilV
MNARGRPGSPDQGETLIEVIMAVAIMGIAVVAIVGGIATTILMSDVHRKQATSGAYVRNYAEAVETYVAAGHFDASASPNYLPATVGFAAPTGFTAAPPLVQCWNDTTKVFRTCAAGNTVQQVTLSISSADSRASESAAVVVRKP